MRFLPLVPEDIGLLLDDWKIVHVGAGDAASLDQIGPGGFPFGRLLPLSLEALFQGLPLSSLIRSLLSSAPLCL